MGTLAATCVWTCYMAIWLLCYATIYHKYYAYGVWWRCPVCHTLRLLINPVNYLCYLCVSAGNKLQAIRFAVAQFGATTFPLLMRVTPSVAVSVKVKDCRDANSCVNSGQNRNANCACCYRPNTCTCEQAVRVCCASVCVCVWQRQKCQAKH